MNAQAHPKDFSPEGFRTIVSAALPEYAVVPFRDVPQMPDGKPFIIMRHDVDHSLELALELARVEIGMGVKASYLIFVGTPLYNLLAPESREILREIAVMGHEIGLHYDRSRYHGSEAEQRRQLELDIRLLENLVGQPVLTASAHAPTNSGTLNTSGIIRNHAYDSQFFSAIPYVSDSNQAWRQWHPLDLIAQGRSFQLLLHPVCWTIKGATLEEKLRAVAKRANSHYAGLMEAEIERMKRSLENRPQTDPAFASQRASNAARPALQ